MDAYSKKYFKNYLSSIDVISFDIFDTAISRMTRRSDDLLFLLKDEVARHGLYLPKEFDLASARIDADKKARYNALKGRSDMEVSLQDIIDELLGMIKWPRCAAELLSMAEIDLEKTYCIKNPEIHSVYETAAKYDKQIIFISDTHLPQESISEILIDGGYHVGNKDLYISSSIGLSKASGELFNQVLSDLNIPPRRILHIGDDLDADYRIPRKIGLNCLYYKRLQEKLPYFGLCHDYDERTKGIGDKGRFIDSFIHALIALHTARPGFEMNFWYELGYECAGPLLVSLVKWLYREAMSDGVERLYFLSRDGQILKIVYDLFKEFYPDAPQSKYLYASRRAWNIPAIENIDDSSLSFLCGGRSIIPVRGFLERIGLDSSEFKESIRAAGFSGREYLIRTKDDRNKLRALFREEKVSDALLQMAKKEHMFLDAYLKQEGVFDGKTKGVVDVGWNGTLQRSLVRLMADKRVVPDVYGYYLGTFPSISELISEGIKFKGYLCNLGLPEDMYKLIGSFVEIYELILYGDHGTVTGFEMNNGLVCPQFADIEISLEQQQIIKEIRRGIVDFAGDYRNFCPNILDVLEPQHVAVARLKRLVLSPNRLEASMIGELEHVEGLGTGFGSRRKLAALPSLRELSNPGSLLYIGNNIYWMEGLKRRLPPLLDYLAQKEVIDLKKLHQLYQNLYGRRNEMI